MKRRELATLTGYSERHISRIAAEIPGAKPTSGGQWTFDETDPGLKPWIAEAHTKNVVQRHLKFSGTRKRKAKMPTMAEDMDAIERFVDAFNKFQETSANIRLTRIGAEIPAGTSYEQWFALGNMMKCMKEIPPSDRVLLLIHYFNPSPPAALTALYTIIQLPIFADFLEEDDESFEAIQIRKETEIRLEA